MVDKSDPCRGVFEEVARWHNTVVCMPTWNELLEIEYVKQRGEVNMFTDNVAKYCFDRGLLHATEWYMRCKDARIHPAGLYSQAIEHYEKEHGPSLTWVTDDIREAFLELELASKEAALTSQLRQLRKRKKGLKSVTQKR